MPFLLCFILVALHGTWGPGIEPCPVMEALCLNQWTTREVPLMLIAAGAWPDWARTHIP